MKQCTRCRRHKPLSEFGKHSQNSDKLRRYCKPCSAVQQRRDSKRHYDRFLRGNPDAARRASFKKAHGLPIEFYDKLFNDQSGLCLICLETTTEKHLVLDHDHKTKAVRGLLCRTCNAGLGMFRDDLDILENAQRYLMEHHLKREVHEMANLVDMLDEDLKNFLGFTHEELKNLDEKKKLDETLKNLQTKLREYCETEYTNKQKVLKAQLKAARSVAKARGIHFNPP